MSLIENPKTLPMIRSHRTHFECLKIAHNTLLRKVKTMHESRPNVARMTRRVTKSDINITQ